MKTKLITLIISLFVLFGCATNDTQQMKMRDTLDIQKSEWRLPGYNLVANVEIRHLDKDKKLISLQEHRNIVVNVGKAGTASRINGDGSEAVFTHIAIGTGTTGEAAGQTALVTEISTGGGQRAVASVSRVTTTTTNDTARWIITYNFTSSFAVTESGIFNAASSGTMLARKVFSAINVVNGDSIQVTWRVQVQ